MPFLLLIVYIQFPHKLQHRQSVQNSTKIIIIALKIKHKLQKNLHNFGNFLKIINAKINRKIITTIIDHYFSNIKTKEKQSQDKTDF